MRGSPPDSDNNRAATWAAALVRGATPPPFGECLRCRAVAAALRPPQRPLDACRPSEERQSNAPLGLCSSRSYWNASASSSIVTTAMPRRRAERVTTRASQPRPPPSGPTGSSHTFCTITRLLQRGCRSSERILATRNLTPSSRPAASASRTSFLGRVVAMGGVRGQKAKNDCLEVRRYARVEPTRTGRQLIAACDAIERSATGEQVVQGGTQPEQVGPRVDPTARRLFWGRIGRCTHERSVAWFDITIALHNAEVGKQHSSVVGDQYIGGLDVAVHQTAGMQVSESVAQCGTDGPTPSVALCRRPSMELVDVRRESSVPSTYSKAHDMDGQGASHAPRKRRYPDAPGRPATGTRGRNGRPVPGAHRRAT